MKPGYIVKLKSGSPSMTVSVTKGDMCECMWFVQDIQGNWESELQVRSFPADALEVVEAKAGR